ncbi:MAG TPA: ATP-binding protein, partial [Motiliproteus sp.]
YEKKLAFMVWNGDSDELLSSFESSSAGFSHSQEQGFFSEQIDQHRWRTFTLHESGLGLWIKVGQRDDVRDELIEEIVFTTLLPLLIAIPLLALVIGLIVSWGLSPLKRVARQIIQRNPDNLLPLPLQQVPSEISGVVHSVNSLMESLHGALTRERRFTADAAHELRTPLAGIRIHAQNLANSGQPDSVAAANQIINGTDRMTRIVEQLLTLSRLEHQQLELEPVHLAPLLRQILAELAYLAPDKELDFAICADEQMAVVGHAPSLAILCRNLIDNAIRYTPSGGTVEIHLEQHTGETVLRVCDTGPGIPADQREAVLQRFVRLAGQSTNGSGLGLAIVKEIAQQHQAQLLLLDSPLGSSGLCVSVNFPKSNT